MNKIHLAIIGYIRKQASRQVTEQVANWSDSYFTRQMFANYREGHGLRLTQFGQQLMQHCFQSFEFENSELQPKHLMFLDRHAKMPYFCGSGSIVIYDPLFAVRLRLVAGSLTTLMEVETID